MMNPHHFSLKTVEGWQPDVPDKPVSTSVPSTVSEEQKRVPAGDPSLNDRPQLQEGPWCFESFEIQLSSVPQRSLFLIASPLSY